MSDKENQIFERLDAIASSLEEECEIVAVIVVRQDDSGNAFVARSTRGNLFELIGLLTSEKNHMLNIVDQER